MSSGRKLPIGPVPLLVGCFLLFAATPLALMQVIGPCPDCRGADLSRRAFIRKVGYCRTSVASIRCPRCGDRGTVSALNRLRRSRVSPDIAALLQAEAGTPARFTLQHGMSIGLIPQQSPRASHSPGAARTP